MRIIFLTLVSSVMMISCAEKKQDSEIVTTFDTTIAKDEPPVPGPEVTGASVPATSANGQPDVQPDTTTQQPPLNIQHGNSIRLSFARGAKEVSAHGVINKKGENIRCYIDIGPGKTLYADIYPDSGRANIRFNQVILPDGKMDGPFGQTLEYPLTQKGVHTLIIGRNLMAENPYVGGFRLVVKVE